MRKWSLLRKFANRAIKPGECQHTSSRIVFSCAREHGLRRRRVCTDCGRRWSTVEIDLDLYDVLVMMGQTVVGKMRPVASEQPTRTAPPPPSPKPTRGLASFLGGRA